MTALTESQRLLDLELSLIRQLVDSAPCDSVNLALGELSFPLPDLLRQQALLLLEHGTPVYTANAGIAELRRAVADYYPDRSPEAVCICNGAEEALFVTLLALLNPGDLVAIPDPDYPAYTAICRMLEARVVRLPYTEDLTNVDWDLWERTFSRRPKFMIFSHPSNPSGKVFSAQDRARLLDLCASYEVIPIVDEIYRELWFEAPIAPFQGHPERLISVGGLSKSHCMSGWRLGWVAVPESVIEAVIIARQYVSTCSNWLSQHLASFALSPKGLQATEDVRSQLRDRRSLAQEVLSQFSGRLHLPAATPYLMLDCGSDALPISLQLAQAGVITVPGAAFGEVARAWMRLNYAVNRDQLARALEIIVRELHHH